MTKAKRAIQDFMTRTPHSIGQEQTLRHARDVMLQHHIRHLPVLHGGALVGLLSEGDVARIEALKDLDPATVTVEEAMTSAVYTVEPDASLEEVIRHMAAHRQGSALVMDGPRVIGIFTGVDVLSAFVEMLDAA